MTVVKRILLFISYLALMLILNFMLQIEINFIKAGDEWVLFVPILLIGILTILLHIKYINKMRAMKKIIATLFILIITIPVLIEEIEEKTEKYNLILKGKATVNTFLTETFGNDNFEDMNIISTKHLTGDIFGNIGPVSLAYTISTPLLQEPFIVGLDWNNLIAENTFSKVLIEEKQLNDKLKVRFINSLPPLPSDININIRINKINLDEFYDTSYTDDELLDRAVIIFDNFCIKMEQYNEEEALNIVKNLYFTYDEKINKYYLYDDWMYFYIRVKTNHIDDNTYQKFVHGSVHKINDNQIKIKFDPYSLEGGIKTIQAFQKTVDI